MERQLWKRPFKAVGGICSRDSGWKLAILSTITLEMLEVNNNMYQVYDNSVVEPHNHKLQHNIL